jgi:hypothetical protein
MVQSAELEWRSPPRLSRCRVVLPDDAWTGDEPHRAAKHFSWRSRCGLSPAVGTLVTEADLMVEDELRTILGGVRLATACWAKSAATPGVRC